VVAVRERLTIDGGEPIFVDAREDAQMSGDDDTNGNPDHGRHSH
jgi:hypothetical protein